MSDPVILVEKAAEGYALLTLNRPDSMNALSRELRSTLADTVDRLEADPDVKVLILTGAGRAFCAGLDLKELAQGEGAAPIFGTARADPARALAAFSGPIIAAINGPAITGGFELALCCDVLLGSTLARFADTHARVGVMPGWGLSQRLSRAIGIYRAKELSLTGNFLSAQQALAWGLLNRVVEPEQLLAQARALATDMLTVMPGMLTAYKKLIDDGFSADFGSAMRLERERADAANASVTAGQIGRVREPVSQRGRAQAGASERPGPGE